MKQIFIGLITEGTTDSRFLESITKRTFEEIGFDCNGDIEIFVKLLDINKSRLGFVDFVRHSSKKGLEEFGISVLCVHTDADDIDDTNAYNYKIVPAKELLNSLANDEYCKLLTPLIPVQMMEAWMLSDKELSKKEIGTTKSDNDLGINRSPEQVRDPKSLIENAIRISREHLPKRRRGLNIGELYQPLGQKISMNELDKLDSFRKFKEEIRRAYRELNYM